MLCLKYNVFFFFKQKTAYEMRISDWSSDVCSSDLHRVVGGFLAQLMAFARQHPYEGIEPEDRAGDARAEQFRPVEPRDMRQFVRDDRLGLARRRDRLRAQHDRRAQHAPADRRTQ